MQSFDFLVVGAGFYGATFARQAAEDGYTCLVIDKRNHIAGNAYTEVDEQTNIIVHKYGPHIFHTNDEDVWQFVNRFGKFNNYIHTVKAMGEDGKLYSLPFNMNTFYELFGSLIPAQAQEAIEEELVANDNPQNLEEYALATVGPTVYNTLIKGYTEKQWNKKCSELPADIIKRLPLRWTFDNRYFNDKFQGIPEEGYTALVEQMLDHPNIEVRLGCGLSTKHTELAETVVYSGAIDEYFNYAHGILEYRSLDFIEVGPESSPDQGIAVSNDTRSDTTFTRIVDHKHFNPERVTIGSITTIEFPKTWQLTDERYYPVNTKENQEIYNKYREDAKSLYPNVIFGGRLGSYRYYDMHQVIAMAMKDYKRWLFYPQAN